MNQIDYISYAQSFLNMEKYAGNIIHNFKYNDIRLWQYLRFLSLRKYYLMPSFRTPYSYLRTDIEQYSCKKIYNHCSRSYRVIHGIPTGTSLMFTHVNTHLQKYEGKLYDPYIDQVYNECIKQNLSPLKINVETPGIHNSYYPTCNIPILQTHEKKIDISDVITNPYYNEYRSLCREYKIPVLTAKEIMNFYFLIDGYRINLEQILQVIKPRMALCMAYYWGFRGLALCHACRNLGIPCIDLQHGLQNWPHIGYCFSQMPENGWEILPEWFFEWGEDAVKEIDKLAAKQKFHKIINAGQPLYNAWKKGDRRENEDDIKEFEKIISGRIPICVALPFFQEEERTLILRNLIIRSPHNWIWLIRKHPTHKTSEIKFISDLKDRIEIDYCSRLNLHDVLSRAKHMVAGASSCVYEATNLHNMRATTITKYGRATFVNYIKTGIVDYADTPEAAFESVQRGIKGYPWPNQNYITKDITALGKALKTVAQHA